ncbi:MAG TPA: DUF2946 family protein [Opitutaceae bacterium]
MRPRLHAHPQPTASSRALALLLAWMVFGLTLAGVSPEVHELAHGSAPTHAHPHGHDHGHDAPANDADHRCVVVLYAHGAALPVVAVELPAPPAAWRELAPLARPALFLPAPRYLRQPERGPPVLG